MKFSWIKPSFITFGVLCGLMVGSAKAVVSTGLNQQPTPVLNSACHQLFVAQRFEQARVNCANPVSGVSPDDAFRVAVLYAQGLGGDVDLVQSAAWLKRAVSAGHKEAEYNLALAYLHGKGVAVDRDRALTHFNASAEAGIARAQRDLATLYLSGELVPQNPERARTLYTQAALQGEPNSQFKAGMMHLRGEGGPKDHVVGQRLIESAAVAGLDIAQYTLAVTLAKHEPEKAARWYERAAIQGNGFAMYNLALLYQQGRGVAQNNLRALSWADQSVAAGLMEAGELIRQIQSSLGQQSVAAEGFMSIRNGVWLSVQPNQLYTLSIANARSTQSLYQTIDQSKLFGQVTLFTSRNKEDDKAEPFHAVFGRYTSRESAERAAQGWQNVYQHTRPQVVSFAELKETQSAVSSQATSEARLTNKPVTQSSRAPVAQSTKKRDLNSYYALKEDDWLLTQPSDAIVVQLGAFSASTPNRVKAFIRQHGLKGKAVYYQTLREAGPFYVVLYDKPFDDLASAKRAVATWPKSVQRMKPWIRTYKSLQDKFRPVE